jgi:hypothetical protein
MSRGEQHKLCLSGSVNHDHAYVKAHAPSSAVVEWVWRVGTANSTSYIFGKYINTYFDP